MPKFKVVVVPEPAEEGRVRNPFIQVLLPIPDLLSGRTVPARVWVIEAASEAEIHELFREAKTADIPNVRGHSIHSIEELPD